MATCAPPCSACSTPPYRRWADACCAAGCIGRCATAPSSASATMRSSALIDARADDLLRDAFRGLGDLERILSRVALRSARPRDLATLRDGLSLLPAVQEILSALDSPRLQALHAALGEHEASARMLRAAIVPLPPLLARDGGTIADGYDAELDELRMLSHPRRPVPGRPGSARTRSHRHRHAEGRLQPRARLLHRDQQGPERQGAGALHAPADADRRRALHHRGTQGLRGQGAVGARTFAVAREAAVRRRARPAQRSASNRCAIAPPR